MTTTRYKFERRDLERFEKKIAAWKKQAMREDARGNEEDAKVYWEDVKGLNEVYDAVLAGDYERAGSVANELATLVRDQIPVRLYNAIAIGS